VDRWIAATGLGEEARAEDLLRVIDFPTTRRYIEAITARHRFYQERDRL
jgi:soluble lytic murein transglycosylase